MKLIQWPVLAALLVLAGCNAGRSAMSGAEQVGAGLGDAVTAPLEDFNLRRQLIPTVLLQAEANPYDLRNLNQCTTIGAEVARLDEAQIANAAVNQVADLWDHPQLQARGRFRSIGSSAGPLRALLPPVTSNGFEARMDPVPALGEHSEAILRELGRSDADIAALRQAGVV